MEATELRTGLPEYTVRESDVNRFMLFLPEHWRRQGTLDTFEPWTLIFLDMIYINLKAKQGKRSWLIVYDMATGGLRIRAVKHKYEIAPLNGIKLLSRNHFTSAKMCVSQWEPTAMA